jgi:hypothetical protein
MIIRQEIVTRVENQLKRIRTGNTYTVYGVTRNYLTDIGLKVFQWRNVQFQPSELPALILRDLDEPAVLSSKNSSRVTRQLHVQIEIVTAGDNSPDDLRKYYADVEAAIGEGRQSVWADITEETRPRITRSVVEQGDTSVRLAGGIYECFIDYPTFAFSSVI